MTPGSGPQIDGQWIDYYALLELPTNADEDTIRRRIGKAYAEASANSEHRNATRREYYRSLVERVLPQCRRVLLDSEWRSRYDHQHLLHREKDGAAQSYVEFIGSMRRESNAGLNEALLPQREQEELNAARQVVETALSGAELELIPSQSVINAMAIAAPVAVPAGAPRNRFRSDAHFRNRARKAGFTRRAAPETARRPQQPRAARSYRAGSIRRTNYARCRRARRRARSRIYRGGRAASTRSRAANYDDASAGRSGAGDRHHGAASRRYSEAARFQSQCRAVCRAEFARW